VPAVGTLVRIQHLERQTEYNGQVVRRALARPAPGVHVRACCDGKRGGRKQMRGSSGLPGHAALLNILTPRFASARGEPS